MNKTAKKPVQSVKTDSITFLVNRLVKNAEDREWTIEQLKEHGPEHKILQNELLFDQLALLVKTVEKVSGEKLQPAEGLPVSWSDKKDRIDFPVPLPAGALSKQADEDYALQLFAEGPEHETLGYSIAIQVTHWVTQTLKENGQAAVRKH